ncbi:hypothetical protein BBP40_004314 [Aspergillus hancockii]|nr:hypothetical protein BBP40_004314 [Aspergillus hancockii]
MAYIKTPTVFLPFITTTYAPLLECDYNLHKSNSTYFTDLDASRSHLLSRLCYDGLRVVERELSAEGKPGMMAAIIGSVTTSFKKEIRIFQQYEVWSRILTWDRKWLYIVTYFVQKGSVKPRGFATGTTSNNHAPRSAHSRKKSNVTEPVIFATAVSKYVFKKGRLTVPPEGLLRASGLLGDGAMSTPDSKLKVIEGTKCNSNSEVFAMIENERLRGMKYAESWSELDYLHEGFLREDETSNGAAAIGQSNDIAGDGFSFT